jgi:hypothetical protein
MNTTPRQGTTIGAKAPGDSLPVARLLLVLASLSPLFILWAIRGIDLIEDPSWWAVCAIAIIGPNTFLLWRMRAAKLDDDAYDLRVARAEDHRSDLLVYLFATLLPVFALDASDWRGMLVIVATLAFIVFLFWHMSLHYMNILFAVRGYRIFTVYPAPGSSVSDNSPRVLITKRAVVPEGLIRAYRISDTVYWEG